MGYISYVESARWRLNMELIDSTSREFVNKLMLVIDYINNLTGGNSIKLIGANYLYPNKFDLQINLKSSPQTWRISYNYEEGNVYVKDLETNSITFSDEERFFNERLIGLFKLPDSAPKDVYDYVVKSILFLKQLRRSLVEANAVEESNVTMTASGPKFGIIIEFLDQGKAILIPLEFTKTNIIQGRVVLSSFEKVLVNELLFAVINSEAGKAYTDVDEMVLYILSELE